MELCFVIIITKYDYEFNEKVYLYPMYYFNDMFYATSTEFEYKN